MTLVIATLDPVVQNRSESYGGEVEASTRARTATEILRQEHESIRGVLDLAAGAAGKISRGEQVPPDVLANRMEFIRLFVDQCHHGKEEDIFFSGAREEGDPHMERSAWRDAHGTRPVPTPDSGNE